jgi:hypothetical protein
MFDLLEPDSWKDLFGEILADRPGADNCMKVGPDRRQPA